MKLIDANNRQYQKRISELEKMNKRLERKNDALSRYVLANCDTYETSCACCYYVDDVMDPDGSCCPWIRHAYREHIDIESDAFKVEYCVEGIIRNFLEEKEGSSQ